MDHHHYRDRHYQDRVVIRHAEPRHLIDLPAQMIVDDRDPMPARLVNLSRHGFRVMLPETFPAGQELRLEIEGWPRLRGHVVWSQGGRSGCLFDEPPAPKIFAMMCASAHGRERDAL